jgi:hypothetical protein
MDSDHSPRPMRGTALFNNHGHNGIFVGFSSFLVCAYNLIYANVANQITRDKDKVTSDDSVRVDVAQSISRAKRLLGRHYGYDFQAG